jgi:hypothetical protein
VSPDTAVRTANRESVIDCARALTGSASDANPTPSTTARRITWTSPVVPATPIGGLLGVTRPRQPGFCSVKDG